jgi:hypothetical protein
MDTTIETLILTELQETRADLRDFRAEVATWREETAKQLSEHSVKIQDVCGNGQPGRMRLAEAAISALQRFRYWQLGAAAGVSAVVAGLGWVVMRLTRG